MRSPTGQRRSKWHVRAGLRPSCGRCWLRRRALSPRHRAGRLPAQRCQARAAGAVAWLGPLALATAPASARQRTWARGEARQAAVRSTIRVQAYSPPLALRPSHPSAVPQYPRGPEIDANLTLAGRHERGEALNRQRASRERFHAPLSSLRPPAAGPSTPSDPLSHWQASQLRLPPFPHPPSSDVLYGIRPSRCPPTAAPATTAVRGAFVRGARS